MSFFKQNLARGAGYEVKGSRTAPVDGVGLMSPAPLDSPSHSDGFV